MNKVRRTNLSTLSNTLDEIAAKLDGETEINWEAIKGEIDDAKSQLDDLKDEEQDYYDNMPSGLQSGDKGDSATSAIDEMESGLNDLGDAVDACDTQNADEVINSLEEARDHINDAAGY